LVFGIRGSAGSFFGVSEWKPVLYLASALATAGALIAFFFIDEGPYRTPSPPFDWKYVGNAVVLVLVCLIWGFAVVADSAQFSACISELCQREYTGTALTLQTSLGFLLTLLTIRLIPTLERWLGWQWAFMFLAIGPLAGIWAMSVLRRSPAAARLAGGKG
jgi:hypothetical protein